MIIVRNDLKRNRKIGVVGRAHSSALINANAAATGVAAKMSALCAKFRCIKIQK